MRFWLLLMLFSFHSILYADIKLYACEKDGVALLQDTPIHDCPDMKTYVYQSSQKAKPEGLREGEKKQLEEHQRIYDILMQRYLHVDENVGSALMLREGDRRYNLCYLYKSAIETALIDIERVPEGTLFVRQAVAGLERDGDQYRYYCGKDYPDLKEKIKLYKSRI